MNIAMRLLLPLPKGKQLTFPSFLLHCLCVSLVHVNTYTAGQKSEFNKVSDLNSNYSSNAFQEQQNLTGREQEVISSTTNSSNENTPQSQSDYNSSVSFNTSKFQQIENRTTVLFLKVITEAPAEITNTNSTTTFMPTISSVNGKNKPLTPEDKSVRNDWGGNCRAEHWKRCSKLETWFGDYFEDIKKPDWKNVKKHDIDCKVQPILCMKNGWTVTRCQIFCMGKCNKALLPKYEKYVKKEGMC